MPIVTGISRGISAPPPRVSWVTNPGHNQLNQPSRKFHSVACPAGVEPATHGLEGLANLQNTMLNNGLQRAGFGVHQNMGGYDVGRGPISDSRYLQAFVGKTDIWASHNFYYSYFCLNLWVNGLWSLQLGAITFSLWGSQCANSTLMENRSYSGL